MQKSEKEKKIFKNYHIAIYTYFNGNLKNVNNAKVKVNTSAVT